MLCQNCKKNTATFNYVEIIGGKKFESHLCGPCYYELFGDVASKADNSLWTGLFGEPSEEEKKCPVCGAKYSDYERTGLLGCPNCYDIFREELIPSIRRIQGKVTHVGKTENNNDELGLHRRLKTLQEQLERALKERRYGEAGRLNTEINRINAALYGGDGNDE